MAQPSGWGSTQNAAALPVVDAFARNMLMRYGGRTDDIWSYHDMPGYKQELGAATSAPGANWASGSSGGSVRISGMGNGGTPSDPGGYNWNTLNKVSRGVGQGLGEAYNFLAERREVNRGDLDYSNPSKRIPGFRAGNTPLYNTYRGKQQQLGQQQRAQNIQAARQQQQQAAAQKQQLKTFAGQTFATAQNIAAGRASSSGVPYAQGAATPLKQGPTPGMSVNLLSPQSQAGVVQSPVFGPALPPPAAPGGATRPSSNRPKFPQVATKGGQTQTRSGIIIPPGTRSI